MTCWKKAARRSASGYFFSGSAIRMVNPFSGLIPGGTKEMRTKLFNSRPAPINKTNESATSDAINAPRT